MFLGLLSVCLGVISLLLAGYAGETESRGLYVAVGVVGAFALAAGLIAFYSGVRWVYARRRRPWVWIAVRALEAAAAGPGEPVQSLGISDRNGEIVVILPREERDFLALGDLYLAVNMHTGQRLGVVEVVVIERDFCLCEVADRMDAQEFWAGIESRMRRDFSPPSGVGFSRCSNQDAIDFVERLIRRWGG